MKKFLYRADRKSISIVNHVPKIEINSDQNIISLVLRNPIANSIKFSAEGGIIDISGWQDQDYLRLIVKDNGRGMSAETIESLFKSTTVSADGTLKEKGTGLGLSLCKDYLQHQLRGDKVYFTFFNRCLNRNSHFFSS